MSGTEHNAPDAVTVPPNAGLLKVALVFATLMQVLDMTIANVALPHMQASLGANQDTISWVLTSYIIASAIAMPVTGWLSDRLGQRRLYLLSVGCFVVASVLCGMATTISEIVVFRLMQGVAGAFLAPLGQTILLNITPLEKRGQAMSIFGMGIMVGPILGPVIGGWLTESMNWRWVFFVNLPFGILAFVCLWFLLPDSQRRERPFDVFGFALLSVGLAALQLVLDRGQQQDWFASLEIWLEAFVAFSAFWVFFIHLATARHPIFPREMLKDRNLLVGMAMMLIVGLVMVAAMALLPIMLENLFGYPVLNAGLLLATRGLGVMLAMAVVGQVANRIDTRLLIIIGFLIVSYTFWSMAHWSLDIDGRAVSLNGFLQGIGMGICWVPIMVMTFSTLDQKWRTDGSGLINLVRSIGSSVGISLVVTLLSRSTSISHAYLADNLTPYKFGFDTNQIGAAGGGGDAAFSLANAEVMRQAMMVAFLNDFYMMTFLTLLMLPLAMLVKKGKAPAQKVSAADLGH